MNSNVPHFVYRQQLCQNGHGYPLWIPEPDESLPHDFKQRGISIGDVGILTERGGFDFLFNIHEAANGSVNEGQVPPGFEPWLLNNRDISVRPFIHKEHDSIISSSVSQKLFTLEALADLGVAGSGGFELEFSTKGNRAAMLVLPHGATGYDSKYRSRYEEYAKKNAEAWYEYANVTLGCGAANGTLYLVTGCDKARSWGTAAASRSSQTRALSLKFQAIWFVESGITFQSSWSQDFGVETRLYPPSAGWPTSDEVHCVFTRGFTIAVRKGVFGRGTKSVHAHSKPFDALLGRSKYSRTPSNARDNPTVRTSQTVQQSSPPRTAADSSPDYPNPASLSNFVSIRPGSRVHILSKSFCALLKQFVRSRASLVARDSKGARPTQTVLDSPRTAAAETILCGSPNLSLFVPRSLSPDDIHFLDISESSLETEPSMRVDVESFPLTSTEVGTSSCASLHHSSNNAFTALQDCNPSSIICTSILKHHSDVDVAIVHDDEWSSVLQGSSIYMNPSKWFRFLSTIAINPRATSHVLVKESRCASLVSEKALRHPIASDAELPPGVYVRLQRTDNLSPKTRWNKRWHEHIRNEHCGTVGESQNSDNLDYLGLKLASFPLDVMAQRLITLSG